MTTAAATETVPVSGRTQPRYTGPPINHAVRWYGNNPAPTYRHRGLVAECEPCGWKAAVDGGHLTAELVRLAAMHAGTEDP